MGEAVEFIEKGMKEGNVLVHCMGGIMRSATVVIAYCMKRYKWSYEKAYQHVKNCRRAICPNKPFIQMLKNKEEDIING